MGSVRKALAVLTIGVLALALAACGGSSNSSSTSGGGGSGGKLTTVKVAPLPIMSASDLYLGIKHGFFKEQGLNVEAQVIPDDAAITAAVVSGSIQFGHVASVGPILAVSKGIKVKAVAPVNNNTPKEPSTVLTVKGDSKIKSVADLAGKKVAINVLGSIQEASMRNLAAKAGIDPKSITLVPLAFPDMLAALKSNRVDAAVLVEPFLTLAKEQGYRLIADPLGAAESKMQVAVWIASDAFIQKNPKVVQGFIKAMEKSNVYANQHQNEVVDITPTFTKVTKDVAAKVAPTLWAEKLEPQSLELQAKLMQKFGLIKQPPPLNDYAYLPSGS